ncbi:hypothetical protein B7463_g9967, partial [Scytalidium lignicola]
MHSRKYRASAGLPIGSLRPNSRRTPRSRNPPPPSRLPRRPSLVATGLRIAWGLSPARRPTCRGEPKVSDLSPGNNYLTAQAPSEQQSDPFPAAVACRVAAVKAPALLPGSTSA